MFDARRSASRSLTVPLNWRLNGNRNRRELFLVLDTNPKFRSGSKTKGEEGGKFVLVPHPLSCLFLLVGIIEKVDCFGTPSRSIEVLLPFGLVLGCLRCRSRCGGSTSGSNGPRGRDYCEGSINAPKIGFLTSFKVLGFLPWRKI